MKIQSPADAVLWSPNLVPPLGLSQYSGATPITVSSQPEDCLSYTRMLVAFHGVIASGSDTTVQLLLQERAGTSGAYTTFYTGTAIADGGTAKYLIEVNLSRRLRYIRASVVITGTINTGEACHLTALLSGRTLGRIRQLQPVTPVVV